MQRSRAGCLDLLVKEWGALAGILIVSPTRTTDFLSRNVASISPSRIVRFFEIVAMRRRPAARRDMHVNEAITTVSVVASEQNGVGVPHDSDVGKARVFVRVRNREIA
jgi:hypothetical protein